MKRLFIGNLEIKYPIVQGGMGIGISLSGLASAVSNAGGIGVISSAGLGLLYRNLSKDYLKANILGLRQEIQKMRAKTKGIIGINIMHAMTNFDDMVNTSIEEKVDIIFVGAGFPTDLPKYLTPESKTKLVPIVSSSKAARLICARWKTQFNYFPDALVIEGPLAGGHLGFKINNLTNKNYSLENILQKVLIETKKIYNEYGCYIPIITAGGIYNGYDMHRLINMGADAVQMGSRFVTTQECDASENFKLEYINANIDSVKIIESPVGMPGRALKNSFLEKVEKGLKHPFECGYKCIKTCDFEKAPYCIINALYNAYKGNFNSGFAFAGTNAYKATKIETVNDIFKELIREYESCEK